MDQDKSVIYEGAESLNESIIGKRVPVEPTVSEKLKRNESLQLKERILK